jgi:hypothetical protein
MNMPIKEHPAVVAHRRKPAAEKASEPLDAAWLRQLCLEAGADGVFNFSACYTHNYREFMGGFTDWVETIADSRNKRTTVGAPRIRNRFRFGKALGSERTTKRRIAWPCIRRART